MVMVWRLPLLGKTLKSLELSSERTRTHILSAQDAQKRYEMVKDLARKRLDQAEMFSLDADIPQHFS
jgi:coenzyme F420-reducing hydrogenase delta subunit